MRLSDYLPAVAKGCAIAFIILLALVVAGALTIPVLVAPVAIYGFYLLLAGVTD